MVNNASLEESLENRLALYEKREARDGKFITYVNISGGMASLGGAENSNQLPTGLIDDPKLKDFPQKRGVMF